MFARSAITIRSCGDKFVTEIILKRRKSNTAVVNTHLSNYTFDSKLAL